MQSQSHSKSSTELNFLEIPYSALDLCIFPNEGAVFSTFSKYSSPNDAIWTIYSYNSASNEIIILLDFLEGLPLGLAAISNTDLIFYAHEFGDRKARIYLYNVETKTTEILRELKFTLNYEFQTLCYIPHLNSVFCEEGPSESELSTGLLNISTKEFVKFGAFTYPIISAYLWQNCALEERNDTIKSLVIVDKKGDILINEIPSDAKSLESKALAHLHAPLSEQEITYDYQCDKDTTSMINNILAIGYESKRNRYYGEEGKKIIVIWNLETQKVLNRFDFFNWTCARAFLLPGNRLVVSDTKNLNIFDTYSKELIFTTTLAEIRYIKCLPNFDLLISADTRKLIKLDVGIRAELQNAYEKFKNDIIKFTSLHANPAGIVSEYLTSSRDILFPTSNITTTKKCEDKINDPNILPTLKFE